MAQLCQHAAEIESLNARIVVVSFGHAYQARAWLEETRAPFLLLLDRERAAYRAYGLDYSLVRSWGVSVWWRYAQLLLAGHKWRGIQGDSGQLGGDFVVDTAGVIQLAYRSRDPADRPPVSELLMAIQQLRHTPCD